MKLLSQLWRLVRLASVGVVHLSWTWALNIPAQDKAALAIGALAATEAAYRQVFPAGKIGQFVKDILTAYKTIKQVQANINPPGSPPPAL